MSIKVMTMVWDAYPASGSELLAMLAMADWCSDTGSSLYPSMNAVAAKIRVSEKQARRIVQSIVERGFMRVVGNANGGKPGTTKQFQIEVGKLRELVLLKESGNTAPTEVTPPASVTPPMQGIDPSQMAHKTPPMGGSLTVIEPSIEPLEKKKKEDQAPKISFDGTKFQDLTDEQVSVWSGAYPAIKVPAEILKAAAWLDANPANKKSDYKRFLNGWLSRAQDKAPRMQDGGTPARQYAAPRRTPAPDNFLASDYGQGGKL